MTTSFATSGVSAATTLPASTVHSELSESSGAPLTLEALAGVVDRMGANIDVINRNMAAIQAALTSLLPPPPPPASQPPPPPTAAITDLARSGAAIQSYLRIPPLQPVSWPLPQSAVASLPPVFPYGMLGYSTTLLPGTTLLPFQDVQPTVQPTLQQIEQALDITPEPVGKMLNCKVSAAVQLQAAARGLLARRQLQEMRQPMHEATLRRSTSAQRSATSPRGTATSNRADPLLSSGASMVFFPRATTSNSAAAAVGESLPSLSPAGTQCLAPPLSTAGRREDVSAGRCRD